MSYLTGLTYFLRFMQVVIFISTSLLFMRNNILSMDITTFYLFISWWIFGLLLHLMSNTVHLYSSFWMDMFSLLLDIYLGVDLLDHMKCFNILKNCQTAIQSSCSIYYFHQRHKRISIFPHHHWVFTVF